MFASKRNWHNNFAKLIDIWVLCKIFFTTKYRFKKSVVIDRYLKRIVPKQGQSILRKSTKTIL